MGLACPVPCGAASRERVCARVRVFSAPTPPSSGPLHSDCASVFRAMNLAAMADWPPLPALLATPMDMNDGFSFQ